MIEKFAKCPFSLKSKYFKTLQQKEQLGKSAVPDGGDTLNYVKQRKDKQVMRHHPCCFLFQGCQVTVHIVVCVCVCVCVSIKNLLMAS